MFGSWPGVTRIAAAAGQALEPGLCKSAAHVLPRIPAARERSVGIGGLPGPGGQGQAQMTPSRDPGGSG